MATGMFVSNCKIGIVAENDTGSLTGWGNTEVGPMYDSADQTYAVVALNTDATIDNIGPEYETFQDIADNYDHDIELRQVGAGSCEFKAQDDSTAANFDFFNLQYAGIYFPNGASNTAAGAAAWNATQDTAITKATDLRGWAVVLEQQNDINTSIWYQYTFHNAKIEVKPSFGPKRATTGSLRWSDARYCDFASSGTTFANHADA